MSKTKPNADTPDPAERLRRAARELARTISEECPFRARMRALEDLELLMLGALRSLETLLPPWSCEDSDRAHPAAAKPDAL